MNKTELIDQVAATADIGISKAAAGRAVDAVLDVIVQALKKGEDITLLGFGTFRVRKRAARKGRNPHTGAEIQIKAKKVASFSPGKVLKDAVNHSK